MMSETHLSDDRSLIECIKTGLPHEAQEAFEQVVARYSKRLFGYLRFKGLTSSEQQDISNETWLRAWENITRFEYRGIDLFPWLRSIASKVISEYYRVKSKKMLSIEDDMIQEEALAVSDTAPSILEQLSNAEIRDSIERVLKEAPSDYSDLIKAKFFMDFEPKEIAQLYSWSMSKVYTTTNRAIAWLRKRLIEYYGADVIESWRLT
jgi:RNA polymerase sigma-70 factor (ECF subfamily)